MSDPIEAQAHVMTDEEIAAAANAGQTFEDLRAEVGEDQIEQGQPEINQPSDETVQLLQLAIGTGFKVLAPNWLAIMAAQNAEMASHGLQTEDPITALALAWAPLAEKYLSGPTSPWVTALMTTGMLLAPAFGQPLRQPKEKPKPAAEKPATAS